MSLTLQELTSGRIPRASTGGLIIDDANSPTCDASGNVAVVGQVTVGGGYGSTGLTVTAAGALSMDGILTAANGATMLAHATSNLVTTGTSDGADASRIIIGGGGAVANTRGASLELAGNEHGDTGQVIIEAGNVTGGVTIVRTANTERIRVHLAGDTTFSATADLDPWANTGNTPAATIRAGGLIASATYQDAPLYLNRLDNDGAIVRLYQDGTEEGSISVSTTTVSYNAFLGSHWSQLAGGVREEILPGTILETIDDWCEWPGEENDRLPRCRVAADAASSRVYGVFLAWDEDEHRMVQATEEVPEEFAEVREIGRKYVYVKTIRTRKHQVITEEHVWNEDGSPHIVELQAAVYEDVTEPIITEIKQADGNFREQEIGRRKIGKRLVSKAVMGQATHRAPVMVQRQGVNDLYCAAIGAYRVRLKPGQQPKTGDLIETSEMSGCGQVQADTVLRSSTVAKIDAALVIETYPDGSFTMPCTLHCG